MTADRVILSLCSRWRSGVALKVWIRGLAADCTASQAASMSRGWARARPATVGPSAVPISLAIRRTASRSSGLAAGKPASLTSTPRRASWRAISSFSELVRLAPGDCSPSRKVVSKIKTRSVICVVIRLFLQVMTNNKKAPDRSGACDENDCDCAYVWTPDMSLPRARRRISVDRAVASAAPPMCFRS